MKSNTHSIRCSCYQCVHTRKMLECNPSVVANSFKHRGYMFVLINVSLIDGGWVVSYSKTKRDEPNMISRMTLIEWNEYANSSK